jgi:hypothetical protein
MSAPKLSSLEERTRARCTKNISRMKFLSTRIICQLEEVFRVLKEVKPDREIYYYLPQQVEKIRIACHSNKP